MKKSKNGLKQEELENLKDELHLGLSIKEIEEMLNYIDKRRKIISITHTFKNYYL